MSESVTDQLLQELIEEHKRLLASLHDARPKTKDAWDRFAAIAPLVSGLAVALVGATFTGIYSWHQAEVQRELQTHQNRVLELQAVEKFIPHLSSGNEATQKAAIIAIAKLSSPGLAAEIGALFDSKGSRAGADAIMVAGTSAGAAQFSPTGMSSIPNSARWVYLGRYVPADGTWESRYLDFSSRSQPEDLLNQTFKVRAETGALNVRDSPLGQVVGGLPPSASVRILEVKNFAGLGYMWGSIQKK